MAVKQQTYPETSIQCCLSSGSVGGLDSVSGEMIPKLNDRMISDICRACLL
jgi:hypothetical protein